MNIKNCIKFIKLFLNYIYKALFRARQSNLIVLLLEYYNVLCIYICLCTGPDLFMELLPPPSEVNHDQLLRKKKIE